MASTSVSVPFSVSAEDALLTSVKPAGGVVKTSHPSLHVVKVQEGSQGGQKVDSLLLSFSLRSEQVASPILSHFLKNLPPLLRYRWTCL